MNILFIAEKDAANASLGKIAEQFKKRGHQVDIYAPFFSANVLRFFNACGNVYPISELTRTVVDDCDIIFASMTSSAFLASYGLFFEKKPILIQNYLVDKQVGWEGDVCFVPSLDSVVTDYDSIINFARVEIGEPKYDNTVNVSCQENRLLFIDSGHYPFGMNAKQELARTLLHICEAFPSYELWIKPRFLPQDKIVTHMPGIHLYDLIEKEAKGKIPSNLIMLREHYDLKEMIDQSHTVLCMYTTAFVGVCVAKKGLVVLDGLPNEDTYDVREKVFERIRETILGSGAIVHYKHVDELLPHGVKCSEQYMKSLLAETGDVATKICEVTEELYNTYYSKGKFPVINNLSYDNIKEYVIEDRDMTWEKRIKERCINYLLYRMLVQIDYRVKAKLDVGMLLEKVDCFGDDIVGLTQESFEKLMQEANGTRDDCIISNTKKMLEDSIDQGVLLNALYCRRHYDEIKKFSYKETGAYHMFRGFVAYEEGEDRVYTIDELEQYMKISLSRTFVKEISDMSNNKMKAFNILVSLLLEQGETAKAKYYFEEMEAFYYTLYGTNSLDTNADEIQNTHYSYIIKFKNSF